MGLRVFYILALCLMLFSCTALAQDASDAELDSLRGVYYGLPDDDPARMGICRLIAKKHYNADSTVFWSNILLDLSRRHGSVRHEAEAYGFLSWAHIQFHDFNLAAQYNYKALLLADEYDLDTLRAYNYYVLACNYYSMDQFELSNTHYSKAIEIYLRIGDTNWVATCYRRMADVMLFQRMYSKSDEAYQKAFSIDSARGNKCRMAEDLLGRGKVRFFKCKNTFSHLDTSALRIAKGFFAMAREMECSSFLTCYHIDKLLNDALYMELCALPKNSKRRTLLLDSMKTFCGEMSYFADKLDTDLKHIRSRLCYAMYYSASGQISLAGALLDSIDHLRTDGKNDIDEPFYWASAMHYEQVGDLLKSRTYMVSLLERQSNSFSVDYSADNASKILQSEYEEKNRLRAEHERIKNIVFLFSLGIALVVLCFVLGGYFRKRRHNKELLVLSDQLAQQNEAIAYQHHQITDSIKYASMIQHSVLPRQEAMEAMFSEFMLIYRPLDIVAGDFYWTESLGKYKVVVCADCTGHGVPGAFVSMLGVSILNEVVQKEWTINGDAGMILNVLRDKLMKALGQTSDMFGTGITTSPDGMDLAMVVVDSDTLETQYAGAFRPLWIYRDGDIIEYKADRMPIGPYFVKVGNFTRHDIQLRRGDVLYMFSDGIPDQFGYIDDAHTEYKHFSAKRFKWLLSEIGDKPLADQKKLIENAIDNWKNGYQQLDDNILIGIRV